MQKLILNKDQVKEVAEILNTKIDIPGVPEFIESPMFNITVGVINDKASEILPENFVDAVKKDYEEGNLERTKNYTVNLLNEKINIPLIGEEVEEKLFTALVEALSEVLLNTAIKIIK